MNEKERLIRARIQIQKKNPFFAYLSLFLKFKESEELEEWAGAGVDAEGNFYYKKEFIRKLSDEEIQGVIIHEILHLALLHLVRKEKRDMELWNVACDILVNFLAEQNDFIIPKECIKAEGNKINIAGKEIKDINKKTAEEIYEELEEIKEKIKKKMGNGGRFDEHKHMKDDGNRRKIEIEEKWKQRVEEAFVNAKMRGDVPVGIERLIGKLHKEQISWKNLLKRYIRSYIPYNYTFLKPHKKSISAGYYMADLKKERIEIFIVVDLSGSIGQEELNDFFSEIIGLAKAYRNRIKMTLLTHEVDVNDRYEIENGSIDKIKKIKIHGGGGTSHKKVFEELGKNKECKVAVFLTDGYSDLNEINFNKYRFDKIFVISKKGSEEQLKNKNCKVIRLK